MKNNKTSKSCSSNNAMPMQSQEAPSPKFVQLSADITKLKSSNNGKTTVMSFCPTSRAVVVEKNKVISVSTKNPDALVKELNWNGNCDIEPEDPEDDDGWADWDRNCRNFRYWSVVLNYEGKTKVGKVVGIKPAKHDNHKALEIKLSTEDLEPKGATASDAVKWASKDLDGKKGVSLTFHWQLPQLPDYPIGIDRYSLYELLENDKDLETIEKAIDAADLDEVLDNGNGDGFTVFAPNDRAFANLPPGTFQKLLRKENKPQLVKILQKHVVSGKFDSKRLKIIAKSPNNHLRALDGSHLDIIMRGSALYVGNAKVVAADVEASNGVFHKIGALVESKK
jgi:uncharacterized surface protein with fasciclin (FAS1) repeats